MRAQSGGLHVLPKIVQNNIGDLQMSITFIDAPSGADEIIRSFLLDVVEQPSLYSNFLQDKKLIPSDVSLAGPIPEYYLDQKSFEETESLIKPSIATCWRYLLLSENSVIFDIQLINKDSELIIFSVTDGSALAESTLEALFAAESDPRISEHDYQLRQLNLPWFHFISLWLHNENDDILIPLDITMDHNIEYHKLYNANEISSKILLQTECGG